MIAPVIGSSVMTRGEVEKTLNCFCGRVHAERDHSRIALLHREATRPRSGNSRAVANGFVVGDRIRRRQHVRRTDPLAQHPAIVVAAARVAIIGVDGTRVLVGFVTRLFGSGSRVGSPRPRDAADP